MSRMNVTCTIEPSRRRIFPNDSMIGFERAYIEAARGETVSAQIGIRSIGSSWYPLDSQTDAASTDEDDRNAAHITIDATNKSDIDVRIRRVGYVPVPLFTAPTDGNRRPSQLVDIRRDGDRYRFDFSDVERYVRLGRDAGFERFEWPHLFSQWGVSTVSRANYSRSRRVHRARHRMFHLFLL